MSKHLEHCCCFRCVTPIHDHPPSEADPKNCLACKLETK